MERDTIEDLDALLARAESEGLLTSWSKDRGLLTVRSGNVTYKIAIEAAPTFLYGLLEETSPGTRV